jgi:hypothetical protein
MDWERLKRDIQGAGERLAHVAGGDQVLRELGQKLEGTVRVGGFVLVVRSRVRAETQHERHLINGAFHGHPAASQDV